MASKKGKKKKEVIIDGVDTSSMTREQLEAFAIRLREQVDREREERQYFQLERDKIRSFWEIAKNELQTLKAEMKNKDYEIEKSFQDADQKVLEEGQRVKHLIYEHQMYLSNLKAEHAKELNNLGDQNKEREKELIHEKVELKTELREQERIYDNKIKELKLDLAEKIEENRNKFEVLAKELQVRYETELHDTKEQLNLVKMMEINETEERKNDHIQNLTDEHNKAFAEIKLFYNDITLNNLAVIKGLKDQLSNQKRHNDRMKAQIGKLETLKFQLEDKIREQNSQLGQQKRGLSQLEKENMSLSNSLSSLKNFEKKYTRLQWVYDSLSLKFEKLLELKNNMEYGFEGTLFDLQAKSEHRIHKLEKKLIDSSTNKCVCCKDRKSNMKNDSGDHSQNNVKNKSELLKTIYLNFK